MRKAIDKVTYFLRFCWNKKVIIIGIIVITSIVFNFPGKSNIVTFLEDRKDAILSLFTIFVIPVLITILVNHIFEKDIKEYFNLIKKAEKAGINKIYENRKEAISAVTKEFDNAHNNYIDILSIAGTDFFHLGCESLNIFDKRSNLNLEIRVLLLDPRSIHAVDRAILEEKETFGLTEDELKKYRNYNIAQMSSIKVPCSKLALYNNILQSLRQLERFMGGSSRVQDKNNKQKDGMKIRVRLYDTAPILFFVKINEKIFIEQYHYGIGNTELEHQKSTARCIAKRVPVIEFGATSDAGKIWQDHFDNLWEWSTEFSSGTCDSLWKQVFQQDDCSDLCNETFNLTGKYFRKETP